MNRNLLLLLLTSASLLLGGCSVFNQVLGNKKSKPIPLKPLAVINKPSINARKAWEVKTGQAMGENTIHPFIDNTAVFIAGSNSASAWQKNTGKLLWKTNIEEAVSAGVNGSTGSAQAQKVFVGTSNGNAIALDAQSGKILWIERLSSEIQSISPSKDGRVVFRTVDGKLHGLASNTGELVWQQLQSSPTLTLRGASVPIIIGPYVVAGFDNGKVAAYGLQLGKKAWEVALAQPRGSNELDRIVDVDGKLKSLGNALFSASMHGSISGINLESGSTAWVKPFSTSTGVEASPQALYSSDNKGNIWRIDPQTGDPVWKMDDLQRYQPTLPVLVGNSLLAIGDKRGNIHWINSSTGKFVARNSGDPAGYAVEPEVSGNSLYTLGKSGILSRFNWK